ncbi:MerR family transcriptional regulator [Edaphosphingomonas haloaromaticamans]|uniref:HTH-type transcriptional regulator HmrR n=1 Tax=Edaphosphingomonas haloaromaticamans TaxID=653954 RepID=A0A1S1H9P5_9SPHN|nr:MerR family transcriptional regulator [Sphingomonas haloaromaticamans]OHT18844.1 HTH-type transcriptional regulator HmrR [Sphingomonas haloaromaticamans]
MNIGEASIASGISVRMIRYYERTGLIPSPARARANYRDYGDGDINRLRFIRRARRLGFTIEKIGGLLALWSDDRRSDGRVATRPLDHIEALERKQRQLRTLIAALEALARGCDAGDRPTAPVVEGDPSTCTGAHSARRLH